MTQTVIDNSGAVAPFQGIPTLDAEFADNDARIVLLPPGRIDARIAMDRPTIDVNINAVDNQIAVNADRRKPMVVPAQSVAFFPRGAELSLAVTNALPGCIIEISERALERWAGEDEASRFREVVAYEPDPVAADMGRAAIQFLIRRPQAAREDHLTLEALSLGIAARVMALRASRRGDIDDEQRLWTRRGDALRLRRAVDWAETHLTDPALSVSGMATAADLSSCHFGVVFKAHFGETPYAFILRRRAEYARDMIIGTDEPIAFVAYASGFSSQAHMTTVVRRTLGVTPGKLRAGAGRSCARPFDDRG